MQVEPPHRHRLLRRVVHLAVALVTAILLTACNRQSTLEALSSPEDRALGLEVVQALQRGDRDKIAKITVPELVEKLAPVFPKMRELLPSGPGTTVVLVDAGFTFFTASSQPTIRHSYLAYEVSHAGKFALVRLGFERKGKDVRLTDFYVNPLAKSTSELTSFTLSGKSLGQYIFLSLTALSFATIVFSLVVLYRANAVANKWLWAIGCSFGFGQFVMDWSTGALSFNPLGIFLFGASAVQAGAIGPWQIGFGVPLVAYWFLLRQAKARRETPAKTSQTFQ